MFCFPFFYLFSGELKLKSFISFFLHIVLTLNEGKIFALPSLFPYI